MNFQSVEFEAAAGRADQLKKSDLPEIVFSGKSNVGKSSLINKLVNRKALARVSATPGKTATINFFRLPECRFVDLPGYGYAKVSQAEKERWGRLMESYFQEETGCITAGVLIVDIRHKPTADDVTMHDWFRQSGCPEIIVANKLDKLKKSQVEPALALIRETLELTEDDALVPFSAEKGEGKDTLIRLLVEKCGG